jgi:hypothetical protein
MAFCHGTIPKASQYGAVVFTKKVRWAIGLFNKIIVSRSKKNRAGEIRNETFFVLDSGGYIRSLT